MSNQAAAHTRQPCLEREEDGSASSSTPLLQSSLSRFTSGSLALDETAKIVPVITSSVRHFPPLVITANLLKQPKLLCYRTGLLTY
ncbi:hypothetical protein CHARACLAT_011345 [Characodon lateralis]|uniref:Uncharacterized protein n=1 Tax=Characodon lateralis TaxID=208331 RepID=A0ABU7DZM7_9TELE|nr:hypothetical protein [Characodon lateralis]